MKGHGNSGANVWLAAGSMMFGDMSTKVDQRLPVTATDSAKQSATVTQCPTQNVPEHASCS